MTNITLAVRDELREAMKKHPEIRWSEIARQAIEEKIRELEMLDSLAAKSRLTEKDVQELGKVIKRAVAKKVLSEAE